SRPTNGQMSQSASSRKRRSHDGIAYPQTTERHETHAILPFIGMPLSVPTAVRFPIEIPCPITLPRNGRSGFPASERTRFFPICCPSFFANSATGGHVPPFG